MGVINTGNFAKDMWPGVKTWWGQEYKEWQTEYTELFDKVMSDKLYEEYVGFSGMGLFKQKPEGEAIKYDSMQQGVVTRATNVYYALGIIITHEMMINDQYNLMKKRTQMLAFKGRQTKEIVGANVFNRAFNSSYTFGDGQPMLSASHTSKAGLWSNIIGTAADLSEASLEQAAIDIAGFKDDAGSFVSIMPRSLHIHRNEMFNAQRILKSIQQSGTANNDINALKVLNIFPEGVAVNHYFTAPKAWFVRTNVKRETGLIYQEREADQFVMDTDSDTLNQKCLSYGAYAFTMADPRSVYGSAGT